MSVVVSLSEDRARAAAHALSRIRVNGGVAAAFSASGGRTRLATLGEHGGYRLRFPHTHAGHAEGVIVNTGGGVVGGDHVTVSVTARAGSDVVVSTQAAEKIYRSTGPASEVDVRLRVDDGASLGYLPQETILFSGARLRRRFEIDLAATASALICEAMVFGRVASGEVMAQGALHDSWRVRRDDRLIFGDVSRLDDVSAAALARPAVLDGARAVAFLLYVAPAAEACLERLRAALDNVRCEAGASAWNGMLVARLIALHPEDMRAGLIRAVGALSMTPLPRVWSM